MRILILLTLAISCSSFYEREKDNSSDTHATKKVTFHQMGLNFEKQEKIMNDDNAEQLNLLAQKIISTSQPVKQIIIFSNPHNEKLPPKMELINYDRAMNAKRFLEKDLHSQSKIKIEEDKSSPFPYKKEADILILVEYM